MLTDTHLAHTYLLFKDDEVMHMVCECGMVVKSRLLSAVAVDD